MYVLHSTYLIRKYTLLGGNVDQDVFAGYPFDRFEKMEAQRGDANDAGSPRAGEPKLKTEGDEEDPAEDVDVDEPDEEDFEDDDYLQVSVLSSQLSSSICLRAHMDFIENNLRIADASSSYLLQGEQFSDRLVIDIVQILIYRCNTRTWTWAESSIYYVILLLQITSRNFEFAYGQFWMWSDRNGVDPRNCSYDQSLAELVMLPCV